MTTPLANLRVLDASRVLAGPFCGQMLGDLGAEVIKLERPGTGDDTRGWGPPFAGGFSAYFLSCNRNKRSLTLDISRPEGVAILDRLLASSDVLIENFRSDSAEKLGLGAEQLLKRHPRLIICSISGFGRTGPMNEIPGYDFAIQAMSGLMAITGPKEGPPFKVGVAVTDILTGLHSAVAILACLRARESSGHGYSIDMSLLDCAIASQVNVASAYLISGVMPARQGNAHLQIVPYQLFATQDGWMVLNVGNDGQWQHFCSAAQRPDLAQDARFTTNRLRVTHREELIPLIETLFKELTTQEWQSRLSADRVPHAMVWDYPELFRQEQIRAREMKITIRDPQGKEVDFVGSPFHIEGTSRPEPRFPPDLGEDNEEILRDLLGLDPAEIEKLKAGKIV